MGLRYNPLAYRIESPAYARLMWWDTLQRRPAVRVAHGLGIVLGIVAMLPDGSEPAVYRIGLGVLLILGTGLIWLRYRRRRHRKVAP